MATQGIPSPSRWVAAAAAAVWLALVIVAALAPEHPGFGWRLFAGIAATVGSVAFAVSGAGLVIERWQRRQWHQRTRLLLLNALDEIQADLVELMDSAYAAVEPAFGTVEHTNASDYHRRFRPQAHFRLCARSEQ
jgi:hypothetical protein